MSLKIERKKEIRPKTLYSEFAAHYESFQNKAYDFHTTIPIKFSSKLESSYKVPVPKK